jgi:glutamate/tyrosine decarboxylase-like PLP-dependent enzyme
MAKRLESSLVHDKLHHWQQPNSKSHEHCEEHFVHFYPHT